VQTGDVLRMRFKQVLAGITKPVYNVFYYRVGTMSDAVLLENMGTEFEDGCNEVFLAPIVAIQTNDIQWVSLEVDNLMDYETDYININFDTPFSGQVTEDYNGSAVAWSYTLVRTNRTTRSGSKRFAAVPVSYAPNNVPAAAQATKFAAVAALIGDTTFVQLPSSEPVGLLPVIAKTPVAPATIPTVFNYVSAAKFRGVGSQNSRKQLLAD